MSGGAICVALPLIGSRVNKFLAPLLGCPRSLAAGLPSPGLPLLGERVEGVCWGSSFRASFPLRASGVPQQGRQPYGHIRMA
jgi:hypothetical protein